MTSPTTDRRQGLVGNTAFKAPVTVLAAANITQSGEQTIDGVAVLATNSAGVPDRVLCTGMTDATKNGIWDVSTAAWTRSKDANGNYDLAQGTSVLVNRGTTYGGSYWRITNSGTLTIGSTLIAWARALASSISTLSFLQSGTGARSRGAEDKMREWVSVMDFGAIGDGTNHPLSERYASLALAQVDYPFATALTQSIDWAAFQAAHNSLSASNSEIGGRIIVPKTASGYYLSDTWSIYKRVTIQGANAADQPSTAATRLIFAPNKDGIRFYSNVDSPNATGADYSRLEGLNLSAQSKGATGHGIHATCTVKIDGCVVRSFKEHGIYINGRTFAVATGNANAWSVRNTRLQQNDGDGLHVVDSDSNVGFATQVESSLNGGWGYYDNAFYCNTYISCQASGNVAGPFYNRNGTGLGGLYIGCYTESFGSQACDFDANVVVIGGVMNCPTGNYILPSTTGFTFNVPSSNRFVFTRNGVEIGRFDTDSTIKNFPRIIITGGASDTTDVNGNLISSTTSTTSSQNRIKFTNPNGQVGSIATSGSATAYNTSSDYRLKQDVLPMAGALAKIAQLRPVTFRWKVDGSDGQGFIAHELQAVFPDAVSGEKDATEDAPVEDADGNVIGTETVPKHQGIDTSFLVATLVAGMQELKADFEAYKAAHP